MLRLLAVLAASAMPLCAAAQAKNVYFYGAILQIDYPPVSNVPDAVIGMSTRSRDDARRVACEHFDPQRGNAALSSPAHLEACRTAAGSRWTNPNDGSTWEVSVVSLECRQARYFAVAMGSFGDSLPPPTARPLKHYIACGKQSISDARDTVMNACRKEYPKCFLSVAALGDGSFGGVQGVSVPNRPFCWGRDAVFDDTVTPAGVKSRIDECRRLAAEAGSPSK
ncbi:MAG TPA: hypothetical protein PKJ45_14285 [Rubrivivax sp.]|nr:hypothetical protein [Rubrivivax sp.]